MQFEVIGFLEEDYATWKALSTEELDLVVQEGSESDKMSITLLSNLSDDAIIRLARDTSSSVRFALFARHNLPTEVIEMMVANHPEDLPFLCTHENAPIAMKELAPIAELHERAIYAYARETQSDEDTILKLIKSLLAIANPLRNSGNPKTLREAIQEIELTGMDSEV